MKIDPHQSLNTSEYGSEWSDNGTILKESRLVRNSHFNKSILMELAERINEKRRVIINYKFH